LIKIWDAIEGVHAVSLKGHAGGVLGLAIVERGRNVLSSARDGAVKLWDVSTQQCVQTMKSDVNGGSGGGGAAMNDVVCAPLLDAEQTAAADGVHFTTPHRIATACENGTAVLFDSRQTKPTMTLRSDKHRSAFNSIAFQQNNIDKVGLAVL
jgi:WD40 repeat protein